MSTSDFAYEHIHKFHITRIKENPPDNHRPSTSSLAHSLPPAQEQPNAFAQTHSPPPPGLASAPTVSEGVNERQTWRRLRRRGRRVVITALSRAGRHRSLRLSRSTCLRGNRPSPRVLVGVLGSSSRHARQIMQRFPPKHAKGNPNSRTHECYQVFVPAGATTIPARISVSSRTKDELHSSPTGWRPISSVIPHQWHEFHCST